MFLNAKILTRDAVIQMVRLGFNEHSTAAAAAVLWRHERGASAVKLCAFLAARWLSRVRRLFVHAFIICFNMFGGKLALTPVNELLR